VSKCIQITKKVTEMKFCFI